MNEQVKAATEKMREMTDAELEERVIELGFGGDRDRFERFLLAMRGVLPEDVSVLLRGSAVIGVRWEDGAPFDADGPGTSDLDLTLVGGDMLKLWSDDAFYIPKLHTAPLNDETPESCPPSSRCDARYATSRNGRSTSRRRRVSCSTFATCCWISRITRWSRPPTSRMSRTSRTPNAHA